MRVTGSTRAPKDGDLVRERVSDTEFELFELRAVRLGRVFKVPGMPRDCKYITEQGDECSSLSDAASKLRGD